MAAGIPELINRRTEIAVVMILPVTVLVLLGLWVGLCETFGGYAWRKEKFFWIALLIGLIGAVVVRWQFKIHPAFAVGVFLLSMLPTASALRSERLSISDQRI